MADWSKNVAEEEGKAFVFRHYGLGVPTFVLRDPELSIGAKALYAHLLTFVNAEQAKKGQLQAWPSRERILKELNISVNTFGKYLRELKDAQLIKVEQVRKTLENGKKAFGNNLYIFQTHVSQVKQGEDGSCAETEKPRRSKADRLKPCAPLEVNTSNTRSLSITKPTSNTKLSTTSTEGPNSQAEQERELTVEALLKAWNQTKVNSHQRLGKNTKRRIAQALHEALEDFSGEEVLLSITTYAEVFKERRCSHRYRLVDFMEKRGYEHFVCAENWERNGPRMPITREDYSYSQPSQDLSQFSFMCGADQDGSYDKVAESS